MTTTLCSKLILRKIFGLTLDRKGGNVLDFGMSYSRYGLREALSVLSKEFNSFSFHQHKVSNHYLNGKVETEIDYLFTLRLVDFLE